MRQQAQTVAQNSRERGAKTANKGKHSYEFKPGDRVYKVRDVLSNADDHKTASKFQGPYVILEKGTNDVYKLANFYTGKVMKNFVHVDKLRSCQNARAARPSPQSISTIRTSRQNYAKLPRRRRRARSWHWPRPNPRNALAAGRGGGADALGRTTSADAHAGRGSEFAHRI